MNDYYIKIQKRDAQIEFSTSDKTEFNQKLAELMQLAGALDKLPELIVAAKNEQKTQIVQKNGEKENENDINKKNIPKELNSFQFENILQKNMKNPKEQVSPNFGIDKKFATIYKNKKIAGAIRSLIFTAGYLILYENLKEFTLKDINRKLFPFIQKAISHTELNTAIAKGLIEVVPNYADLRALTQYSLTYEGEDFYNELIR